MARWHRDPTTWIFVAVVLITAILAYAVAADAQTDTSSTTALRDAAASGEQAVNAFRAAGWMAGLVALLNAAVNLTKLPMVRSWIEHVNERGKDKRWVRPVMSVVLGILGGFAIAYDANLSPATCLIVGIVCGLAAIGGHELASHVKGQR